MKTNLSSTTPSQLETDCLVVVVLDHSEDRSEKEKAEKDKPAPSVECDDAAVVAAAKDVIASGEVTGKIFETTLLHNPAGLKAKRLLLIGGGKAKNFSAAELRKLAGTAVRTLKGKSIRSFVFEHGAGDGVPSP
ncbi:MAG: M17 family peptidase N-terminal domain-containing protein, partial [Terriglobales bacterium]